MREERLKERGGSGEAKEGQEEDEGGAAGERNRDRDK